MKKFFTIALLTASMLFVVPFANAKDANNSAQYKIADASFAAQQRRNRQTSRYEQNRRYERNRRYNRRARTVYRTRYVRYRWRTYRETYRITYLPNGRVITRRISRVRVR